MSENSSEHSQGKITRRGLLFGALAVGAGYVAAKISNQERPEPQIELPFSFRPLTQEQFRDLKEYSLADISLNKVEAIKDPKIYRISDTRREGRYGDMDYSIFKSPSLDEEAELTNVPNKEAEYPFFGYPVAEVTKILPNTFKLVYLVYRQEDLNPSIRLRGDGPEIGGERFLFVCQRNQGDENFVPVKPSEYGDLLKQYQLE